MVSPVKNGFNRIETGDGVFSDVIRASFVGVSKTPESWFKKAEGRVVINKINNRFQPWFLLGSS